VTLQLSLESIKQKKLGEKTMESLATIIQGLDVNKSSTITFPVSAGLLEGKHVNAMGIGLWCFLWCINRVTFDRKDDAGQSWGQVLGGYPLTHQRIADELSLTLGAVRYQIKRLEENGYLRITRCREGQIIEVAHSIKWNNRKQKAKSPEKPYGDAVPSLADMLRQRQESREH
jgi:hypothetical protein